MREASWNRRVSDAAYSDGIGGRPSHCTLSSAIRSSASASGQLLDLGDDGDTVGLLAGNGGRALLFGGALLLTLGNRFAHRLARRVEPLHQRRVDLDVGLQFGPREPHVGQRRRRLLRIGRRHQRFRAMQQTDRALRDRRRSSAPPLRACGCAASSS